MGLKSMYKAEIVVVLNNIRSSENVGSIFRTSDAAGVEKIILAGYTPAPVDRFGRENKGLTKASLGAEKSVAWERAENLEEAIKKLKDGKKERLENVENFSEGEICEVQNDNFEGSRKNNSPDFLVIAIEQDENSINYKKLKSSKLLSQSSKLALVFGNEVEGISKEDLKLCDLIAEIPMRGSLVRQAHHPHNTKVGKESLNVSVSAGIVLFELIGDGVDH